MYRNAPRRRNVGLWVVQGLLAAAGLAIIMVGATASTLAIGGGALALVDVAIGVLAASVVYGRREVLSGLRLPAPRLQPAAA